MRQYYGVMDFAMKPKFVGVIVFLLAMVFLVTVCMKTAGPGEAGIKVNLAGDNRGVEDIPIMTGRIFYNPLTQSVLIYPVYMQTYTWTKDPNENSNRDESITFNSKEGLAVNADISLAFKVDVDKLPSLYVTYRKPIQEIIQTYLRSSVRKAFVDISSTMTIEEIYGEKKSWLTEEVTSVLNERLKEDGFIFDYVTFVGELRVPDKVRDSINAKIEATQRAIQAENELRQAEAEARKRVATAQGEADSIMVKARAEAEANRLLVDSLGGPENYVRLEMINKIGDKINVMMVPSGSTPLIGLDSLIN